MTPEQITELQHQLGVALASLDWQTERANTAVNRFQEARAERDALQARVDRVLAALQESKQPALGQSFWRAMDKMVAAQNKAIEILTGEGES